MTTEEVLQALEQWKGSHTDRSYLINPLSVRLIRYSVFRGYRNEECITAFRSDKPSEAIEIANVRFLGPNASFGDCAAVVLKRWQEKYGEEVQP